MNKLETAKRHLGLLWMLLGPAAVVALVTGAVTQIDTSLEGDIHQPLPWIIILAVFTPIAIGLTVFGWYAWRGEYREK